MCAISKLARVFSNTTYFRLMVGAPQGAQNVKGTALRLRMIAFLVLARVRRGKIAAKKAEAAFVQKALAGAEKMVRESMFYRDAVREVGRAIFRGRGD